MLDRDGDRIGSLEAVFYDSSDSEPEWLGIGVGLLGRKLVLVPAEGVASIGFAITLPLSTDVVRKAPELRYDELDASTLQCREPLLRARTDLSKPTGGAKVMARCARAPRIR